MTPAEQGAFEHLRKVCGVAFGGGESLTGAVSALHEVRDAIHQRDALIAMIREVADFSSTAMTAESGIAQIVELIDDFTTHGNRFTKRGNQ